MSFPNIPSVSANVLRLLRGGVLLDLGGGSLLSEDLSEVTELRRSVAERGLRCLGGRDGAASNLPEPPCRHGLTFAEIAWAFPSS